MRVVQFVGMATAQASVYLGVARQCIVDTGANALRILDGMTPGGFATMMVNNNLSDLTDVGVARTHLELGTAALEDIGAFEAAGTALLITENLSDLNNVPTARTNLGLGTAAVEDADAFDPAGSAAALFAAFHDKTSTRVLNTLYTNTTGKALFVAATVIYTNGAGHGFSQIIGRIGGAVAFQQQAALVGQYVAVSLMVPASATYSIDINAGDVSLDRWSEIY